MNQEEEEAELSLEERYEKLREVVGLIAFDSVELSHDQVMAQRNYYQKICRRAWYLVHDRDPTPNSAKEALDDRF